MSDRGSKRCIATTARFLLLLKSGDVGERANCLAGAWTAEQQAGHQKGSQDSRTKRPRSAKSKTCLPGPVVMGLLIFQTLHTKATTWNHPHWTPIRRKRRAFYGRSDVRERKSDRAVLCLVLDVSMSTIDVEHFRCFLRAHH